MKQTKRFISIVLCLLMLIAVVPVMEVGAGSLTEAQFNAKLTEVKTHYPQGCNSDTHNWYIGSSFVGAECHGYARWLSYYVWGVDFANGRGDGWSRLEATASTSSASTIKPGDIVRYRSSTSVNHTIFITSVSGNQIGFTDNNRMAKDTIAWDGSMTKTELHSKLTTKLYNTSEEASTTGYGYIAHYSLNTLGDIHTHLYKEGYEGAHPHRYYMKCSCGDWYYTGKTAKMTSGYEAVHPHRCYETCSICNENFLTGTTTTVASCLECNRPSKPSVNNLKSTYCFTQKVTLTWTATTNTTHYNVVIQKKSNGNWIVCKRTNYASSDISYQLDAGDYRVQLQSYNSNKWENDGSDWLHTLSSWQYFTVINHAYNTGTVTKAATCVTTGTKTYTCTVCNATKTETIAINASNHVNTKNVAATASTCTVKGYTAGVYCNDCKKYVSGHAEQPLAAHTLTTQNAKAATCTAEGYTGDHVCTVCKQTITKGTAIAKKAHTLTTVNQKSAGCTTAGYTGDQYCTTCKQTITKGSAVAALGHTSPDGNGNCTRCGTHIKDVTPSQPSNPQPNPNACKYCGQVHTGPFGWLIKFFHSILAIFKR